MKSKIAIILSLFITIFLAGCSAKNGQDSGLQDNSAENSTINQESYFLREEIKNAIVSQHKGNYLPGECYGVGYKIIENFEEEDIISVYALVEYIEYAFQGGMFVNISGTNPCALMRFEKTGDDSYNLIYFTRLDIFSELSDEELEELMLPLKETGKEYLYTDRDLQYVRAQCDEMAEEYLKTIGRQAQVGRRSEHQGKTITDIIRDRDFADELLKDPELNDYPDWLGTTERVEDGVRYILKTEFDENNQIIIYTKQEFDSGETVKVIKIDIRQKIRAE